MFVKSVVCRKKWTLGVSIPLPPACEAGALPFELSAQTQTQTATQSTRSDQHTHTHTHTPTRHKTHQTKPHTTASQRHPSTHRQASLRTHYNDRPLHQHISTREAPASTPCRFSALRHGPLPHIPEASNRQAGSHPPPKTKMSSSWLTRTLLVRPASGPDRGDTQHRAQSTQHKAGRLVCGADQALGELFSRSPSCPNSCGILRLAVGVVAPHSPTKKVGRL